MAMVRPDWVDYSGAKPILLPIRLLHHWRGFYLPTGADESLPDLVLSDGSYKICDNFDFEHPKTDYDRACALGGSRSAQPIMVGPGQGLVFATELDRLTWWPEQRMVVNGAALPVSSKLNKVTWSDDLAWETEDTAFVLMNACNHGADPAKGPHIHVALPAGKYVIQRGQYGWAKDDPSLILFRFTPRETTPSFSS
jgi:hypothetical protein